MGWKPRAPGHLRTPGPARRPRSRVTAVITPASPRPGRTLARPAWPPGAPAVPVFLWSVFRAGTGVGVTSSAGQGGPVSRNGRNSQTRLSLHGNSHHPPAPNPITAASGQSTCSPACPQRPSELGATVPPDWGRHSEEPRAGWTQRGWTVLTGHPELPACGGRGFTHPDEGAKPGPPQSARMFQLSPLVGGPEQRARASRGQARRPGPGEGLQRRGWWGSQASS